MMGRPALGASARNKSASVRLTLNEEARLTVEFGSPGRALRLLVQEHFARRDQEQVASVPHAEPARRSQRSDYPDGTLIDEHGAGTQARNPLVPADPMLDDDDIEMLRTLEGEQMTAVEMADALTASNPVAVMPMDGPHGAQFSAPAHRHKRGAKIATEWDQGTKVEVFACAVEGCAKEMR